MSEKGNSDREEPNDFIRSKSSVFKSLFVLVIFKSNVLLMFCILDIALQISP